VVEIIIQHTYRFVNTKIKRVIENGELMATANTPSGDKVSCHPFMNKGEFNGFFCAFIPLYS
jgi:hypothetical protein